MACYSRFSKEMNNSGIIYDARKIKLYNAFESLVLAVGRDMDWGGKLWIRIISTPGLTDEMFYYLEHNAIQGNFKAYGYNLLDLYVHSMDRYNLFHDTGKNTSACSKESLVLSAFEMMCDLIDEPEKMLKKLSQPVGMDMY